MEKLKKDRVATTIAEVVREKITSGDIISVDVERGEDSDGEGIIVVKVVFDAKAKLDASETAAVTRHLRRRLIEMDESRFPLLSFLSKKEAANLAAA